MADPLEIALKLLLKHDNVVNVLAAATAEHAQMIEQGRERCHRCKTAATVRNLILQKLHFCDHCAASLIIAAKNNVGRDGDLDLTLLRGLIMDEDAWVDLPGAIAVRRAQDLVTMANYGVEPPVPEDPSQWH
jgi:hypothetical protein